MKRQLFRIVFCMSLAAVGLVVDNTPPAQATTAFQIELTADVRVVGGIGYPLFTLPDVTRMPTLSCSTLPGTLSAVPACHTIWDHMRSVQLSSSFLCIDTIALAAPNQPASAGLCSLVASGTISGHCNLSGGHLTGVYTDSSGQSYSIDMHFTGVGSMVLSGHWQKFSTGERGKLGGVLQELEQYELPGGQSCTNKTAERFTYGGTITGLVDPATTPMSTTTTTTSTSTTTTTVLPPIITTTPPPGTVSDDCTGDVLLDGFVGSLYQRLRLGSAPNETWLCYLVQWPGFSTGGKVLIQGASTSGVGIPGLDSSSQLCSSTAGNTVPGPHPLVGPGQVGDPDEPPLFVPYMVDTYATTSTTWVCLEAGTAKHRVTIPLGASATPPSVTVLADSPPAPPATAAPAPTTPSGTCQQGASKTLLSNLASLGTREWLYVGQPSANVTRVCARVEGAANLGGYVTIDASGAAGFVPTVTTSTDVTPCTSTLFTNGNPVALHVARTPTGANPTSVCVTVGTTSQRVTVTTGSGSQPTVTWTPDPGTPG